MTDSVVLLKVNNQGKGYALDKYSIYTERDEDTVYIIVGAEQRNVTIFFFFLAYLTGSCYNQLQERGDIMKEFKQTDHRSNETITFRGDCTYHHFEILGSRGDWTVTHTKLYQSASGETVVQSESEYGYTQRPSKKTLRLIMLGKESRTQNKKQRGFSDEEGI